MKDGSDLLVSPEHKVYADVDKRGDTSNPCCLESEFHPFDESYAFVMSAVQLNWYNLASALCVI